MTSHIQQTEHSRGPVEGHDRLKGEVTEQAPESEAELNLRLESLEVNNQQTFQDLLLGYGNLIERIDGHLKDPTVSAEDKKRFVQEKKVYQDKMRDVQTKFPEYASVAEKEAREQKTRALIERIPDELKRKEFAQLLQNVPENLQAKYLRALESALGNKDEATVETTTRGVLFELSRIHTVLRQGLEQVDFTAEIPGSVEYLGFDKKSTDLRQDPTQKLQSDIDCDVPIVRNGELYVYEAKSFPRRKFGSLVSQRNQMLKYQSAIEQGLVDGATIEIKGRIDPDFLKWATGTNVTESGKIPDVELLYTFDLPSGAEYRFILKRSRKNNGLNFQNENRLNTPEATLKRMKNEQPEQFQELLDKFGTEEEVQNRLAEDRKVINGIQRAVIDRSIVDILATVDIENPPTELLPHLVDPTTIKSADLFDQYEALRKESIYKKLSGKREIINVDNNRNACTEFASREYVERSLREYQDYLKQNPEMARVKKAYILDSEEDISAVIDKVMTAIEKVKTFELERQTAEEMDQNPSRAERTRLGYRGRPEGIALDIEHFTIDAIQEVNKKKGQKGRSYDAPERFMGVEALQQYLPGQDRRFLEISIFDPVTGTTEKNTDVNETHIKRTSGELVKENVKRAEEKVKQMSGRFEELSQKETRSPEEERELRTLSARMKAVEMNKGGIEVVKQKIEVLKKEKVERIRAEKDNVIKKTIAAEFDDQILQEMERMTNIYKEVLGGDREWDKIAKRISEKVDQNILKFIYVVKEDGEIVLGEEVVRGDVSGRAAHSELAQGRNVYGGGELAFTKGKNGQWTLTEINNGSGHYRPSVLTLPYVKSLLQAKGIDTGRAEMRDTLLRGVSPPDLTMLEE